MLSYLLEKFDNIKKDRALYCKQIENAQQKNEKVNLKELTIYEFICKNTRKN